MTPAKDDRGGAADRRAQPVTMREVAAAAGVSISTVSHVVNDNRGARIGEAARERVRRTIDELGYRPNAMAKTLVHGASRFIGLVSDAIATTPFAGQIIHGAQEEAWRHGHVLLIADTQGNRSAEEEAIGMMLAHRVRGIVYSTWYHRGIAVPRSLVETDAVLVNCYAESGPAVDAVVPDEVQGGRDATRLLLDAGHRRVAFVNTTTPSPARSGRLRGYRDALASAGIPFSPGLVVDAPPDQEGGYAAAPAVLDRGATAVFCHNDRMAMGMYDGLRERGLRVPSDIAVVGFDNQEVIAAHLHPPLTTMELPHYSLGAAGVRLLLGLEERPANGSAVLPCPVVRRESAA